MAALSVGMDFAGIERTSMVDWPGQICSTVFTKGCNFRCPYCHNPELVLPERADGLPKVSSDDALAMIAQRKKLLDGVCITGGEPLLHPEIEGFMREVKKLGLKVKLDTNGSNFRLLKRFIDEGIVDYIAMDIKAPPKKYPIVTNVKVDISEIERSVRLILESGVAHEFRTTVVRGVLSPEDIEGISEWIRGADAYYLQQFAFDRKMLDPAFESNKPYTPEELREMLKKVKHSFNKTGVRGV